MYIKFIEILKIFASPDSHNPIFLPVIDNPGVDTFLSMHLCSSKKFLASDLCAHSLWSIIEKLAVLTLLVMISSGVPLTLGD